MTLTDWMYLGFILIIIIYALTNKGEIKKKEEVHKPFEAKNHERND